ncbi:phosphonopyruvate decarboxylase [Stutzerimonas nitrititolerans]|uniref:phosphonopyruvate decarboxylase n=1 Tax=Stutzerimonas nitrititolerans TaxID=2482751 RepID=UPI0028A0EAAD|nr:phosphonopyruvate decarboxylase [Stutzerimonas nitrititolerans]
MLSVKGFYDDLVSRGVGFFTGVPDSLLASFCAYVDDHSESARHVIAANEGNAIALAMGFHLSTQKIAAVYMQNSGIGNAINPLASLADAEVYKIPILLIIGWRGEPCFFDEPQHRKQGRITLNQLDVLEIPYWIIDADVDFKRTLQNVFSCIRETSSPVALVVRAGTFELYKSSRKSYFLSQLTREAALRCIVSLSRPDDLIISTTGKTSRELYELRVERSERQQDFLTVGGMGHTASIALGVVLGQPRRRIICLDGDGSLLMHMGGLAIIAQCMPKHFIHVLLNNGAHESVGGQPTAAMQIDFRGLTKSVGYSSYALANNIDELCDAWEALTQVTGPVLLEVRLKCGSRSNLGRPTTTTYDNKNMFMEAACADNRE